MIEARIAGVGNRVIAQLLASVTALSVLFILSFVAVPERETTVLLVSHHFRHLETPSLTKNAQERNLQHNKQDVLDAQLTSTLTSSDRGKLLSSLQTLLSEREAAIPHAVLKTRPCGFGRFANIPCDKPAQEQVVSRHFTSQELARTEQPMQQEGVAPLALGDLPRIKEEMIALEAEIAQQHAEMKADAFKQDAEMETDRAEIEKLEHMQVRTHLKIHLTRERYRGRNHDLNELLWGSKQNIIEDHV